MITQGAFNLLFRPGLRKNFLDSYQFYEPEYTQYLNQGTMDGPEIEASIITGLKRLHIREDGEPVIYEDPKLGPKVVGGDKEFALGFLLTRRTVEDDKYGKANQASKWLGEAARMTFEYRSSELLDDAFTGTTFLGIDGLSMCSTAHTLINSALTVSNRMTTPVGFSVTGVNALLNLSQLCKNENGDPMKVVPDSVIYNPLDIDVAMKIFGGDLEPFTADNDINTVKRRLSGTKQVVKRYTVDQNDYFLQDSNLNDAWFMVRRPVEFTDEFDFDTDAAKFKTTTRFLVWFVDWRGWYGSNPA